ncbi:Delta and Notch-like epidermal growth factor-related receptor [Platysternon megacephalum]|uniref:Delta and Notch-like epidermal growth factor-related receptor n=1 Tax=Platysternon megacephalum TaxID=55544 RepID=A0A4D9DYE0_9SAUR|nr:Delta and Notch-like epidermal growth factor-related receptor [Platysternon megacephalum]
MPRAAPLLLLLLSLAQRRACLAGSVSAASPGPAGDPCLSQPCWNNGTCSPAPARGPAAPRRLPLPQPAYSCACPAGVTGTHCQVQILLFCYGELEAPAYSETGAFSAVLRG